MSARNPIAKWLFGAQPEGCSIPYGACLWAVRRAESQLGCSIIPADLERCGSKLLTPLLLLASTRTKKVYRWGNEHRCFAANELLARLSEECWPRRCVAPTVWPHDLPDDNECSAQGERQ